MSRAAMAQAHDVSYGEIVGRMLPLDRVEQARESLRTAYRLRAARHGAPGAPRQRPPEPDVPRWPAR